MTEEKKVKRPRRPLPDGVAGRLIGMGIEIEVPAVLWEAAKVLGANPKEWFRSQLEGALLSATVNAKDEVQREKDRADLAAFEALRAKLEGRGLIAASIENWQIDPTADFEVSTEGAVIVDEHLPGPPRDDTEGEDNA